MVANFIRKRTISKKNIAATLGFVFSGLLTLSTLTIRPKQPSHQLTKNIHTVKQQVKQQSQQILQRKKFINEERHAYRQQTTLLKRLDIITTNLDQNTKLNTISLHPQNITIQGLSQSESSINNYMMTLKKNTLLANIKLGNISLGPKQKLILFRLSLEATQHEQN